MKECLLDREAEEAKRKADASAEQVQAILDKARHEIAELQGQHKELSSEDLQSLASYLIQQWKQDAGVSSQQVRSFPRLPFKLVKLLVSEPVEWSRRAH